MHYINTQIEIKMTKEQTAALFDEVMEAFTSANKQMDEWTQNKYTGLYETFNRYGKLFPKQITLLQGLTKYADKAPSTKRTKKLVQEQQITESMMSNQPSPYKNNADENLISFVEDFQSKLASAFIPTKEEIFKYGYAMKQVGKPYSPPNRWADDFKNYEFKRNNG